MGLHSSPKCSVLHSREDVFSPWRPRTSRPEAFTVYVYHENVSKNNNGLLK
jgi:hypothetical protein